MSEGGTYLANWAFAGGRYRLWLRGEVTLEAVGSDFDDVADELADQVLEWCGDGEAVLEFPFGRPGSEGPGVLARLRNLGYNESVRALNRSRAQFEGGICSHCGFGIGQRTEVPLRVEGLPNADLVGVDRTLPWATLVSEDFLSALNDDERGRIRTLPVESQTSSRFFEVVGEPIARVVGVSGADYAEAFHQSWRCRECGRRMMGIQHPDYPSSSAFLSAEDLDVPTPSLFVFDEGHRLGIAMSPERWGELAGSAGTKRVSTSDLFMVADSQAEPEPALPDPESFDWVL